MDTSVKIGKMELSTPLVTASGTFGYGTEYLGLVDYSSLGAITVKGVRLEPWPGNAMPRHVEVPGGLVNAIGLQGPGVEAFIEHYLPLYREKVGPKPVIVNIWGSSIEEYAEVASRLDSAGIEAVECNVSCPNVKEGGHVFGHDPAVLGRLVAAVRKATKLDVIVKLAPNVTSVAPFVKACEDNGADAISLINTFPAMVIDVEARRPVLANKTGGLSGRGIHPAAVKLVYDARCCTKLPIIAMGGVYDWQGAVEFMLAGANAVAIGTATFSNPGTAGEVLRGMVDYARRHSFASLGAITGALEEA